MGMLIRRPTNRTLANRWFDNNWREMMRPFNEFTSDATTLALDVDETDAEYTIRTALPGVKAEDIDIRLHDGVLTIAAEINESDVEEGTRKVIRERRYGKFSRSLRFNNVVNGDNIDANYEDGLLTVIVPKAEEAQPRQIPVNIANGNGHNN